MTYRGVGAQKGSGHRAGYDWAGQKEIDPKSRATRYSKNSPSFDQGVDVYKRNVRGDVTGYWWQFAMPFKSEAQRRFMYSQHPEIAERWQKETPRGKLPKRKKRRVQLSEDSLWWAEQFGINDLPRNSDLERHESSDRRRQDMARYHAVRVLENKDEDGSSLSWLMRMFRGKGKKGTHDSSRKSLAHYLSNPENRSGERVDQTPPQWRPPGQYSEDAAWWSAQFGEPMQFYGVNKKTSDRIPLRRGQYPIGQSQEKKSREEEDMDAETGLFGRFVSKALGGLGMKPKDAADKVSDVAELRQAKKKNPPLSSLLSPPPPKPINPPNRYGGGSGQRGRPRRGDQPPREGQQKDEFGRKVFPKGSKPRPPDKPKPATPPRPAPQPGPKLTFRPNRWNGPKRPLNRSAALLSEDAQFNEGYLDEPDWGGDIDYDPERAPVEMQNVMVRKPPRRLLDEQVDELSHLQKMRAIAERLEGGWGVHPDLVQNMMDQAAHIANNYMHPAGPHHGPTEVLEYDPESGGYGDDAEEYEDHARMQDAYRQATIRLMQAWQNRHGAQMSESPDAYQGRLIAQFPSMYQPIQFGEKPPNLGVAEKVGHSCASCKHFKEKKGSEVDDQGRCALYDYVVKARMVCDAWTPTKEQQDFRGPGVMLDRKGGDPQHGGTSQMGEPVQFYDFARPPRGVHKPGSDSKATDLDRKIGLRDRYHNEGGYDKTEATRRAAEAERRAAEERRRKRGATGRPKRRKQVIQASEQDASDAERFAGYEEHLLRTMPERYK